MKKGRGDGGGGGGGGGIFACCFGGGGGGGDRRGGKEGDDSHSLSVQRSATSVNAVVAERSAGDVVGEMSLLSIKPAVRSASVRAMVETRCSIISKDQLMENLKVNPELLEELRLSANRRESELLLSQTQLKVGAYNGPSMLSERRSFRERLSLGRISQSGSFGESHMNG